jgi:hypothetical protein
VQFNTRTEVHDYLQAGLDLVDALAPPDDLRELCFAKAVELLAGKQVVMEPIAQAAPFLGNALGGLPLR